VALASYAVAGGQSGVVQIKMKQQPMQHGVGRPWLAQGAHDRASSEVVERSMAAVMALDRRLHLSSCRSLCEV
jgi:hypothetical protein